MSFLPPPVAPGRGPGKAVRISAVRSAEPIPGNLMVYPETGLQIVSIMFPQCIHQDGRLDKVNLVNDTNTM